MKKKEKNKITNSRFNTAIKVPSRHPLSFCPDASNVKHFFSREGMFSFLSMLKTSNGMSEKLSLFSWIKTKENAFSPSCGQSTFSVLFMNIQSTRYKWWEKIEQVLFNCLVCWPEGVEALKKRAVSHWMPSNRILAFQLMETCEEDRGCV